MIIQNKRYLNANTFIKKTQRQIINSNNLYSIHFLLNCDIPDEGSWLPDACCVGCGGAGAAFLGAGTGAGGGLGSSGVMVGSMVGVNTGRGLGSLGRGGSARLATVAAIGGGMSDSSTGLPAWAFFSRSLRVLKIQILKSSRDIFNGEL